MDNINYIDEYLKLLEDVDPTSTSILRKLRSIEKDTPLDEAIRKIDVEDETTLILNYYITQKLTLENLEELLSREAELEALSYELPFHIHLRVYEPDPRPAIILRGES